MSCRSGGLMLIHAMIVAFTISFSSSSPTRLLSSVGGQLPVLDFINELPLNSQPWELRCGNQSISEHYAYLKTGGEDQWRITNDIGYSCNTLWGNQFAYFPVYQPEGEYSGKATVFWSAKADGLYRSWDKTAWTREYDWDHE